MIPQITRMKKTLPSSPPKGAFEVAGNLDIKKRARTPFAKSKMTPTMQA